MVKRDVVVAISLFALGVACVAEPGAGDLVADESRPATAVTWTAMVNVDDLPDANDLTKISGSNDWNAGAVSVQRIERRGLVKFTTAENNKGKAIGLSSGDNGPGLDDLDFAFQLHSDGQLSVREAGVHKAWITGGYASGDAFRIEVKDGKVSYYQNDQWRYTSQSTPTFPLLVDTSLRSSGATLLDVAIETTVLHVATHEFPLAGNWTTCATNDVISVPGSVLYAGANISLEDFLAKEVSDIRSNLVAWRNSSGLTGFTGTLVLDMENPHPKDLWMSQYPPEVKNKIVDAWIRRIKAAEIVFDPPVRIGMYGTMIPASDGTESNVYLQRLDAMKEAGKAGTRWGQTALEQGGLYTRLDVLVPVLYVRYGCDRISGPCDFADVPAYQGVLVDYTEQGVTGSRQLAQLPLLPLLTVSVATGDSGDWDTWMLKDLTLTDPRDPEASLEMTLGLQLDRLAALDVADAALWIGNGNNYTASDVLDVADADNTEHSWTIGQYSCSL